MALDRIVPLRARHPRSGRGLTHRTPTVKSISASSRRKTTLRPAAHQDHLPRRASAGVAAGSDPAAVQRHFSIVHDSARVAIQRQRMDGLFGAGARPVHGFDGSTAHSGPARQPVQRRETDYSAEELEAAKLRKSAEGIPEAPLGSALKFERFRKLNRIGGALDKRKDVPRIDPVVGHLKTEFGTASKKVDLAQDTPLNAGAIHDASLEALSEALKANATDVTPKGFETYSMLGPLDYWVQNKVASADLQTALKQLRLKMAERPGVGIVAHRGHGPTNRTRGGLIPQADPRRTGSPAENSKSAFDAAFANATKAVDAPALDGVECDVFLSKDDVPILSHEGAVQEQLSTARQLVHTALVDATTHVEDLTAEQLKTIQRTASVDSAFLTLGDFLNATRATAEAYFKVTGQPFRVEIEMKGHPSDAAVATALHGVTGKKTIAKKKAEVNAGYAKILASTVAKIVSRFKKDNPGPWWEIILFNNSAEDAAAFDELRKRKSHLGGLYTGLGSSKKDDVTKTNVDELRMAASLENLEAMKDEKGFIVTYVPGAERPFDSPKAPLGELGFASSQSEVYKNKVNAEMRDTTGSQADVVNEILERTKGARNVHLLTDIPANAAKYKKA